MTRSVCEDELSVNPVSQLIEKVIVSEVANQSPSLLWPGLYTYLSKFVTINSATLRAC